MTTEELQQRALLYRAVLSKLAPHRPFKPSSLLEWVTSANAVTTGTFHLEPSECLAVALELMDHQHERLVQIVRQQELPQ